MPFFPLAAGAYRFRPLRRVGDDPTGWLRGWDVWALQKALSGTGLGVGPDGVFGHHTESAVKSFQAEHDLTVDGSAGPLTQRTVALGNLWEWQGRYNTPPGLGRGIIEGESGYLLGAYSAPYGNGTRDVGLVQRNGAPDENFLIEAFDAPACLSLLCRQLRERKNVALGKMAHDPGHPTPLEHERAWKYGSVLSWNWPAASAAYVAGTDKTWKYGTGYRLDSEAPWVEALGIAGVHTGRQWCEHYIASKVLYVASKDWSR